MNKILMMIIDGIGISNKEEGNFLRKAELSNISDLYNDYAHSLLETTGDSIGLPDGVPANEEISHVAFGAGKKVKQDVTVLNEVLGSTLIEKNDILNSIVKKLNKSGGTLHLAGLVSDGRVASDIRYIENFINHLKNMGLERLYFHAITDGIDSKTDAKVFLDRIQDVFEETGLGKLVSICGRSYAMDKDNNWNRTKIFTDLLFLGNGAKVRKYSTALDTCKKKNVPDNMIPPIKLIEDPTVKNGDIFLWLNFQDETSRQVLKAISDDEFVLYQVNKPENFNYYTLLQVDNMDIDYLIEDDDEFYSIGTYFSNLQLTQARISSKERYPMVTYFFDGYKNDKLDLCDTYLIPSMQEDYLFNENLENITKQVIKCVEKDYNFILVDIPYADIIARYGNEEQLIQTLQHIDKCVGKIFEAVEENFYKMILTSSYGNVEEMVDSNGNPNKNTTTNPVPFIITDTRVNLKHKGNLTMVAPTILKYMDIALPKQMSQMKTLIEEEG